MSLSKFEPPSKEDVAKLQQQSDDVYRDKLTKGSRFTEKTALDGYTNGMYDTTNLLLYGELEAPTEIQETLWNDIWLIDSAMNKWEQKNNITVYRGAKAKHYENWIVGEVKTIPAFVSTSVSKKDAQRFCNYAAKEGHTPIMIEIHVPKGARGIYIGDNTNYKQKEGEFLLGRNSKYKVIENKDNILRLEVVP